MTARNFGIPEGSAGPSIRESRRLLGWSKAELARRLGVWPSTVTDWGENPPRYVRAYLDLALELKAIRDLAGGAVEVKG